MEFKQAIRERHSVRRYTGRKLEPEVVAALRAEIDAGNAQGGLHMQLVIDEPKAFSGFLAHYGKFRGVSNYIALIGEKGDRLDEKVGYYGERAALYAQTLGLNTCWVAATFGKSTVKKSCAIGKKERLVASSRWATEKRRARRTNLSRWESCTPPRGIFPNGSTPAWRRRGLPLRR